MTLQRGSTGPAVTAVQTAVGGATGGGFGDATVSAVSAFQSAHGLAGDGVVGPQTWRALLKATAPVPAPTSGGPYDAYENTVLRVGSTGTAVKVLQQALHLALVDGDFGPGTRSAVIAFQTSAPPDGRRGRHRARMARAGRRQDPTGSRAHADAHADPHPARTEAGAGSSHADTDTHTDTHADAETAGTAARTGTEART